MEYLSLGILDYQQIIITQGLMARIEKPVFIRTKQVGSPANFFDAQTSWNPLW